MHFSIELHAGFSYKEGSLVVHNLPAQATEAEVGSVFRVYGDLRGVARHSSQHQHSASFSVEFCSIQVCGMYVAVVVGLLCLCSVRDNR